MAYALQIDNTAAKRIAGNPDSPVLATLRDILARHAVELVREDVPGANKGQNYRLSSTDGHQLTHGEESDIVDELMLADTQGYISGATGVPQPRMS